MQAEIADRASAGPPPGEAQKIEEVAGRFRSKAVNEVVDTEREVERGRGAARVSQIIDYIFYVIYALLGMRFLLALLAARSSAGFVQFIVTVTNPFYAPFRGIVASPQNQSGPHAVVADCDCDHRLRAAASGDQRITADAGASQDGDLIDCQLPICDC